ncbi:endo-1,4-B-xylanase B [Mycena galericulata]|nr:endo-1,4-B-xylanase B [Mycena galericulata]
MVFVGSLLVILAAAAAGFSQTLNMTGVDNNGYYYNYFSEDSANITITNYEGYDYWGGIYLIQWSDDAQFLGGKGFETGSSKEIQFWADYSQTEGINRISLYGWTTDPLVEYRIVEDFSSSDQFANLTLKGNVTSDGSVYNIYETQRVNETSIQGISTFSQYWSVRQTPRVTGVLNIVNHVNAWSTLGMPLGDFNYQILAAESYSGSGSVQATISHCVAEYGQCGGQSWDGPTCCAAGLTCLESNMYFYNCFA